MITEDQLWKMFQSVPEPEPVVLKLYYTDQGEPIVYTCDTQPGNYIEVDPESFAMRSMRVKVVNGVLNHIPPAVYSSKLIPSNSGTLCHSQDIAIIVNNTGTYWKRQTYEN